MCPCGVFVLFLTVGGWSAVAQYSIAIGGALLALPLVFGFVGSYGESGLTFRQRTGWCLVPIKRAWRWVTHLC